MLTHQMSYWKHMPKNGLSYRRQVVHQRPQAPQEGLVVKPETLPLNIPSLVCKSDIKEGHYILSNTLFRKNVRGQKHPRGIHVEKASQTLINHIEAYNTCKHSGQDNQCPERAGHHRPSLPPLVRNLKKITNHISYTSRNKVYITA